MNAWVMEKLLDLKVPGAQLSWERESWATRYGSSQLKEGATKNEEKHERVKPLITYCDSVKKRLKLEQVLTPPVPIFSHGIVCWLRMRGLSTDVGGLSLLKELREKGSSSLMGSGVRGRSRG